MRTTYSGNRPDSAFRFDAELVENIVCKMHRGKASGRDSVTVEHLYYCRNCVLAKFVSIMKSVGKVPVSIGHTTIPLSQVQTQPRSPPPFAPT